MSWIRAEILLTFDSEEKLAGKHWTRVVFFLFFYTCDNKTHCSDVVAAQWHPAVRPSIGEVIVYSQCE